MNQYAADEKTVREAVDGGGLLVVAQGSVVAPFIYALF